MPSELLIAYQHNRHPQEKNIKIAKKACSIKETVPGNHSYSFSSFPSNQNSSSTFICRCFAIKAIDGENSPFSINSLPCYTNTLA